MVRGGGWKSSLMKKKWREEKKRTRRRLRSRKELGRWNLRESEVWAEKMGGAEIWRNRRAAQSKTNRKMEGWGRRSLHGSRLVPSDSSARKTMPSVERSPNAQRQTEQRDRAKQKAIVRRSRIREKKKQHERHQHRGQVTSSRLQQQEGQKVVFIRQWILSPPRTAKWRLARRVNTSEDFRVVKSAAPASCSRLSYRGAESTAAPEMDFRMGLAAALSFQTASRGWEEKPRCGAACCPNKVRSCRKMIAKQIVVKKGKNMIKTVDGVASSF